MSALEALIARQIEIDGPISVARYMQLALQHPEHGYYVKAAPLGTDGDFVTAPEISQMFGELIGLWCLEMWRLMGSPPRFALCELGAGRGTLLQDALRATKRARTFHASLSLYLLESNRLLEEQQRRALSSASPCHIQSLSDLPKCPTIFIANEFLDSMPVHQYENTDSGWHERMVGVSDRSFAWTKSCSSLSLPFPSTLPFYEISPQAIGYVRETTRHIKKNGGAALWIDYGYIEPCGWNTLQALKNHKKADPLVDAGEADLTAHVDFSAIRLAAEGEGGFVSGIEGQGAFLRSLGIEIRAAQLKLQATDQQKKDIDVAVYRLTDEKEMGSLFKVMAITSLPSIEVPGFS